MKNPPTSYWTFFCNPVRWAVDDFLRSGGEFEDYSVPDWQADWFRPGQLGVVRVGVDKRTKRDLGRNERLEPGIYAVVEILGRAKVRDVDGRLAVDLRYLQSLIESPLLLEDLRRDPAVVDAHLINGYQASSMPLDPSTFDRLVALIRNEAPPAEDDATESPDSFDAIARLESKYAYASPRVKEVVSERIERGPVGDVVKAARGFRCQVCEALDLDPVGFRKPNGTPYVEAHHVFHVSRRQPGILGPSNLITVCANHHRQLHYGDAGLLGATEDAFRFLIDGAEIKIPRLPASDLAREGEGGSR